MRALPLVATAILLVGCQPTDQPAPTQLHGLWGGYQVELRDSSEGQVVLVRTPCRAWAVTGPVAVDDNGHFSADAAPYHSINTGAIHVSGTVYQDSLTLAIYPPGGPSVGPLTSHVTAYPRQYGVLHQTGWACAE